MGLNDNQLVAIELLANPDNKMSMRAIADEAGVTPRTLRKWRKDPEFQAELNEAADDRIDSTLYARAADGDIRAIKEYNRRYNRVDETETDPLEQLLEVEEEVVREIEHDVRRKVIKEMEAADLGHSQG